MDITRDLLLDADPDEVWRLLSDDEELSTWLGDEVRLDLRPGGTGTVRDGAVLRHARVDEVVAGRRLVLTWWGDDRDDDTSRVSFDLERVGDRTRLTVVERRSGGARCSTRPAVGVGPAWDDRLLGLELRLVVRAGAHLAMR